MQVAAQQKRAMGGPAASARPGPQCVSLPAARAPRSAAGRAAVAAAAAAAQPTGAALARRSSCALRSRRSGGVAVRAEAGSSGYEYDLVTIGAGSGGVRASRFATSYGAKVACVELPFDYISSESKGGVGGTCVLRGCVPKKLMVYASEYADEFKDSVGFGWEERPAPAYHWGKFLEAKRKELQRLNGAYKNTLKNANVELLEGFGRVVDAHTVQVGDRLLKTKNILIAVGGKATRLPIPGAELCITSDEALELPGRPDRIAIIGGGFISLEFSGIFKRFGADVHTVFRQPLPLRGFDEDVRKFAFEQYAAAGLTMHPGFSPVEVRKQDNGLLTLVLADKDGNKKELPDNDHVMMATGRSPKIEGLGLEEVGVKIGKKGQVVVDAFSQTSVPSIWAVGDVTDRINLTPVALMEGMALAKTIALNQPTKPDYWAVPSAVFSNPNIATVGLTEQQAVEQYGDVDIYTSSFRPMRNTVSGSPLRTFMKLVVDAGTGVVLGCHMVGDDAPEIMQGFAVAVKMGVTKEQLDSVVGIHPSAAEELVTMRTVSRQVRQEPKGLPLFSFSEA